MSNVVSAPAADLPPSARPDTAIAIRRAIISLLIIFHLTTLFIWLNATPLFMSAYKNRVVIPYMRYTGCWQNWGMFSPNPSNDDSYYQARITYKNGDEHLWYIPRDRGLGFFTQCARERFRKYCENASTDQSQIMWRGVAIWSARQNYMTPLNPPVQVTLVRYRRWLQPMGAPMQPRIPTDFYGVQISPKDLQ